MSKCAWHAEWQKEVRKHPQRQPMLHLPEQVHEVPANPQCFIDALHVQQQPVRVGALNMIDRVQIHYRPPLDLYESLGL
jgi:hypothetical protein